MVTYTNQKILHINKPTYENAYLSVGIEEWAEASKNLAPNTFKVYLYLCGNKDGFDLALSKQAVVNLLGISGDSYKRAIKELTDKNYIVPKQGNIYDFYTKPMVAEMHLGAVVHLDRVQECTEVGDVDAPRVGAEMHPEISKTSKTNKTSKEANAKRDTLTLEEELDEMDDKTLKELKRRFKLGFKDIENHGYKILKRDFNLQNDLDKHTGKLIDDILSRRAYKIAQEKAIEFASREEAKEEVIDTSIINDKWIPKDDESTELFNNRWHSDLRIIKIICKLLKEGVEVENIPESTPFSMTGVNPEKIRECLKDSNLM